jgi:hypothetical protein
MFFGGSSPSNVNVLIPWSSPGVGESVITLDVSRAVLDYLAIEWCLRHATQAGGSFAQIRFNAAEAVWGTELTNSATTLQPHELPGTSDYHMVGVVTGSDHPAGIFGWGRIVVARVPIAGITRPWWYWSGGWYGSTDGRFRFGFGVDMSEGDLSPIVLYNNGSYVFDTASKYKVTEFTL